MFRSYFHALSSFGCLAALLFTLCGCDSGGSNAVSNVRIFNAVSGSQNVGGVDARLRQTTASPVSPTFVGYGSVSANQQRATGDAQDTFLVYGNNPQTSVSSQKFDYKQDNVPVNSTGELLVAKGVVGQTSGDADPNFIYVRTSVPLDIIRQNNSPTASVLLRVVNAAPNSGNITVYNEQGSAPITDLSGIAFGTFSSGGNTHSNFATLDRCRVQPDCARLRPQRSGIAAQRHAVSRQCLHADRLWLAHSCSRRAPGSHVHTGLSASVGKRKMRKGKGESLSDTRVCACQAFSFSLLFLTIPAARRQSSAEYWRTRAVRL